MKNYKTILMLNRQKLQKVTYSVQNIYHFQFITYQIHMTYYRVIKISLNNDIIMIAYIGNIDFRQTYLKIYSIFYEQL